MIEFSAAAAAQQPGESVEGMQLVAFGDGNTLEETDEEECADVVCAIDRIWQSRHTVVLVLQAVLAVGEIVILLHPLSL